MEEDKIITNSSFLNVTNYNDIFHKEENGHSHSQGSSNSSICSSYGLHFMCEIFCTSSENVSSEKCLNFSNFLNRFLNTLKPYEVQDLKNKLTGHVGIYDDGYPWIDFEAAFLFSLHADLWRPITGQPMNQGPVISPAIKESLQNGKYVPIQHILHSLTISLFNPEIKDYIFSFTKPVPYEFLGKIKRSDVIRGANVHALILGSKFPLLAVRMPCIIDELWHFMFPNRFSALAGIELYNEFFYDFTKQLGNCVLPPMDHIPTAISEKVASKYTHES